MADQLSDALVDRHPCRRGLPLKVPTRMVVCRGPRAKYQVTLSVSPSMWQAPHEPHAAPASDQRPRPVLKRRLPSLRTVAVRRACRWAGSPATAPGRLRRRAHAAMACEPFRSTAVTVARRRRWPRRPAPWSLLVAAPMGKADRGAPSARAEVDEVALGRRRSPTSRPARSCPLADGQPEERVGALGGHVGEAAGTGGSPCRSAGAASAADAVPSVVTAVLLHEQRRVEVNEASRVVVVRRRPSASRMMVSPGWVVVLALAVRARRRRWPVAPAVAAEPAPQSVAAAQAAAGTRRRRSSRPPRWRCSRSPPCTARRARTRPSGRRPSGRRATRRCW